MLIDSFSLELRELFSRIVIYFVGAALLEEKEHCSCREILSCSVRICCSLIFIN